MLIQHFASGASDDTIMELEGMICWTRDHDCIGIIYEVKAHGRNHPELSIHWVDGRRSIMAFVHFLQNELIIC